MLGPVLLEAPGKSAPADPGKVGGAGVDGAEPLAAPADGEFQALLQVLALPPDPQPVELPPQERRSGEAGPGPLPAQTLQPGGSLPPDGRFLPAPAESIRPEAAAGFPGRPVLTLPPTALDARADGATAPQAEERADPGAPAVNGTGAQPRTLPPAPASAAAPLPMLAGQAAFDQALGERLVWMVRHGSHEARVSVSPEHLGPLDIRIRIVDGDTAHLGLTAAQAAAREALEQALPRLRELFSAAGLELGQVDIGAGERHAGGRSAAHAAAGDGRAQPQDADAGGTAGLPRPLSAAVGLVDLFA